MSQFTQTINAFNALHPRLDRQILQPFEQDRGIGRGVTEKSHFGLGQASPVLNFVNLKTRLAILEAFSNGASRLLIRPANPGKMGEDGIGVVCKAPDTRLAS